MISDSSVKKTPELLAAAWVEYLNQLRISALLDSLHAQDVNLDNALRSLDDAMRTINVEIIQRNRGGEKGMHGFIAEVAEVGIENAKNLVQGKAGTTQWVNDNGVDDLRRGALHIQQKFVNAGGHYSLTAVLNHLDKYPDFLKENGVYQIPKDHYDTVKYLLGLSPKEAGKLAKSNGQPTYGDWKLVHSVFDDKNITLDDLESASITYDQAQRDAIGKTMQDERRSVKDTDKQRRASMRDQANPSMREGMKAAGVAAIMEGGTETVLAIRSKIQDGRRLNDFDANDWAEIAQSGGLGIAKGGVRGAGVYLLSNVAKTPAAAASAMVTAAFGIAEQANLLRNGEISEIDFYENSTSLSLDVAVSTLSSTLGQAVIPVPVLGALIGNAAGTFIWKVAKDSLNKYEQDLVNGYVAERQELDKELAQQYQVYVESLNASLSAYYNLLDTAFNPNLEKAFAGSVELARSLGVDEQEILKSQAEIDSYFLD